MYDFLRCASLDLGRSATYPTVRAVPARTFLFVLTVEGVEVWTFPSDRLSDKLSEAGGLAGNGKLSEESGLGGVGTPLSLPAVHSHPSPRPCLLHVQQLEVSASVRASISGVGACAFHPS